MHWSLVVVLICTSLVSNGVEHLWMCIRHLKKPLWGQSLSASFPHFLIGSFGGFVVWWFSLRLESTLPILDASSLLGRPFANMANIFFQSVARFVLFRFVLFIRTFTGKNSFWSWYQLINFLFCRFTLLLTNLRIICPALDPEDFPYAFL